MKFDFSEFFEKYEALLKAADKVFEQVRNEYPEEVKCKVGCADCCHALFDLTLIEAIYINHHFHKRFEGREAEKSELLEKANRADRQVYKLKRNAVKAREEGKSEEEILTEMARERVRCPLLNADEKCALYENRPITCRFYGIPTAIAGSGHTCGMSGFMPGEPYPTVNLDIVHRSLQQISSDLAGSIPSKYTRMAEMLVPLSMALLTVYDEDYLGLKTDDDAEKEEKERKDG